MKAPSHFTPVAEASSSVVAPGVKVKRSRGYAWALVALTALSAFLCFNRLSVPPMLIDECFTYWRVCGSLNDLLDTLRNDAFMPLHYELLNWIGQGFPLGGGIHVINGGIALTPTVMRFFPALCGTLQPVVMYFLARQLFNRRTALMAAALIACSAYGLYFSRNAKMYAPAWMFETLAMACFLWWMRSGQRIAWLCWMAAGVAAGGFHAVTLLVLVLLPPLFFIARGKFAGWRIPGLVLGLAVISAAPALYYGVFNRWTQNSGGLLPGVVGEPAPDANWQASGLNWIRPAGDSVTLPLNALNNYLSGYDWVTFTELSYPPPMLAKLGGATIALAAVTYGLLILGALPWPHLRNPINETSLEPWWRSLLYLSMWMVLPVYGFFYCRSVDGFSSPLDWLNWLAGAIGPYWWPVGLLGAGAIAALLGRWPRLGYALALPLLLLGVLAVIQTARNRLDWMDYVAEPVGRIALAALVPALLFHFGGDSFRQRARQLLGLVAVVAVVLVLCEAAAISWRWLHAVSMRKHPELPWQSIWHVRYTAIVMPAVWLAAAALIARLPARFIQVAAVVMICSYNLANGLAHQYAQTEVPLDRAMADMVQSRPDSDVRTYFDMADLINNPYYRPLAAYNACIAAGLRPTPAGFRNGRSWPYQWGSIVGEFKRRWIYNSSVSSEKLRRDTSANPQLKRVIVWEVSRPSSFNWSFSDPIVSGLGEQWSVVSDEQIIARWPWTWGEQWIFRRREFHRRS